MTSRPDKWTPSKIKALRERMGLNQADFAKAIGTAQSTVCRLETGTQMVSKQTSMILDVLKTKETEDAA